MDFQRRDVNCGPLCHVATWISNVATSIVSSLSRRDVEFQRRDVDFHDPLERRDVVSNVATWILMSLWNVATLIQNVATLIQNVATLLNPLSVTSRRCPVLRPRTVIFARHLAHTTTETLDFLHTCLHQPCRSPFPTGRRSLHCLRPPLCISESPFPTGSWSLWHSHHTVLGSSLGLVF